MDPSVRQIPALDPFEAEQALDRAESSSVVPPLESSPSAPNSCMPQFLSGRGRRAHSP
jgi:hypothetical protein